MKETTLKVIALRKEGKTYKEICSETGLSRSNISYLCNKYVANNSTISPKSISLASDHLKSMREKAAIYYAKKREEAKEKWELSLKKADDKTIFYMAGLFDGEGSHVGYTFSISNSDPRIIHFIIGFLQTIEAEYSTSLFMHASHDREICIEKWGIKLDYIYQFDNRKQKRDYSAKENYGTVRILVRNPLGLREALWDYSQSKNYESKSFKN